MIKHAQKVIGAAEEIFDKIKNSLTRCNFSLNSIESQLWGILRRIDSEYKYILDETQSALDQQLKIDPSLDFSKPLRVVTSDANFNPDEYLSLIIKNSTLTLKMFCYNNNYYHQGVAVVPDFIEPTDSQVYQAGSFHILAAAWNHIDDHSKSCLYFNSKITKEFDGEITTYNLEKSELALKLDIYSYISDIRLHDKLTQKITLTNISHEESAFEIIEEVLHINIKNSTDTYNGLTINEIITTYMAIQSFTHTNNINNSIIITKQELNDILIASGISSNKVDLSIAILLFGESSEDLFDSPLLKINQEKYYLITPAVKFTNAAKVTLSKISSLKHQIHAKGKSFEAYAFDFLKNANLHPVKIKFTEKNEEYEYDLVFEFDGYIFILECKNVSLPGRGSTGHLNHFKFLEETIAQVHRLKQGLVENKKIVKDRFKIDIDNKKLVFVILHNLPYCIPNLIEGIYVSDFTSFTKPITQPSINHISIKNNKLITTPVAKLREDADKLQPADLINNLNNPVNFEFAKRKIMLQPYKTPIEPKTCIDYKIITTV